MNELLSSQAWKILKQDWLDLQEQILSRVLDEKTPRKQRKTLIIKHNFLSMVLETPEKIRDEFIKEMEISDSDEVHL